MNATHLHLILTHFPIVGTLIGVGILAYGLYSNNIHTQKVALVTFIAMAILTIPVFLSGEEAEETVEHIAGISERLIENHEELAEIAIWVMAVLGMLSLINLLVIIKELPFAKQVGLVIFIVSLITFGFFAKVGSTGGEIRHSEIRVGNTNMDNRIYKVGSNEKHRDHDDD
jgi:uncharacterized membrane protein